MENSTEDQMNHIKGVIESLLFVNEKPVTLDQIKRVLGTVSAAEIKQAIQQLNDEHEQRSAGMKILEIAGGYQMLSNPSYATYIRSFYKTKHKEKLSKPALETLAIIAYKQPVTRSDVEMIRGVNSDGVVSHLFDKELIKIIGKKDVPGKPYIYGTTKQFLEYFGLKSLDSLPKLEEFSDLLPYEDKESSDVKEDGSPEEGQPSEGTASVDEQELNAQDQPEDSPEEVEPADKETQEVETDEEPQAQAEQEVKTVSAEQESSAQVATATKQAAQADVNKQTIEKATQFLEEAEKEAEENDKSK